MVEAVLPATFHAVRVAMDYWYCVRYGRGDGRFSCYVRIGVEGANLMLTKGLFTSNTDEWATPKQLFDKLNAEFHFNTDVCATAENAKCSRYYTKEQDGLKQEWRGVCWMNPPYGREIEKWIRKAYESALGGGDSCMLSTITNRYAVVSRLLSKVLGYKIHTRANSFQRIKTGSTVPERYRSF